MSAIARSASPMHVVIAGAGITGLETLLALHALAGSRVRMTVLAPTTHFVVRAESVGLPFAHGEPTRRDVRSIVAAHSAELLVGSLRAVRRDERAAVMHDGEQIFYDALVVAVGAQTQPAYDQALTFRGAEDAADVSAMLGELEAGRVMSVAFVVPPGVTWSLPIYELALMTAGHAELQGLEVEITLVTHERAPLALLGDEASAHVAAALASAGVGLLTSTDVGPVGPGDDLLGRDGQPIAQAERIVALPRLSGPAIDGLPHDADGFVPVDDRGHVLGAARVYAVGDVTADSLKHGGLGAQQAEHAAHDIAQQAGAPVAADPPHPILRARLLEGSRSMFLRAPVFEPRSGAVISAEPLWWPPLKVASPRLARHLAQTAS